MAHRFLLHSCALIIAMLTWVGINKYQFDIQHITGPIDARWMRDYTPYFSGMDHLDDYDIFSPENTNKKKILFLGASSTQSIGCDFTWHTTGDGVHNVHELCSIAGQMNNMLARNGFDDWRVFNLAINGGKLTNALYIYSRIRMIKPDIVILGDTYDYYLWDNAGIATQSPAQIAYMDKVFGSSPDTSAVWSKYKQTLELHGWTQQAPTNPIPEDISVTPQSAPITLEAFLSRVFVLLRAHLNFDAPPARLQFKEFPQKIDPRPYHKPFVPSDPDLGYFKAVNIINDFQRSHDGRLFVVFMPYLGMRYDVDGQAGVNALYGGYLRSQGIDFASHIDMDLKLSTETYDGSHQTIYGNRRIAAALFSDLVQAKLLH